MLTQDITINPGTTGGANVNNIYNLVGFQTDNTSIRRIPATAATAPETLTIKHQESKRGPITIDRHLVRFDSTFNDSVKGPVVVSSWAVIEVPRGVSVVGNTQVNEVLGRLHALLGVAGVKDKLINGEY